MTNLRICTGCSQLKVDSLFAAKATIRNSGVCKSCKSLRDKQYRLKNSVRLKKYFHDAWRSDPNLKLRNRIYKDNNRFGFDTSAFRMNGHCGMCGISNQKALEKYGKQLNIDHINNLGRNTKYPDNRLENLQLLCQSCHTIKSNTVDHPEKYSNPERSKKIWNTRRNNLIRLK